MRHTGRLAASVIVGMMLVIFPSSRSGAQPFYIGGSNNMFRVFGCPPLATLNIHGYGPTQQGDCTSFQTGTVTGPAVPIEAWVTEQVSGAVNGVQAQNEKLQRQVDELTARVQALEAALNRSKPGAAPK